MPKRKSSRSPKKSYKKMKWGYAFFMTLVAVLLSSLLFVTNKSVAFMPMIFCGLYFFFFASLASWSAIKLNKSGHGLAAMIFLWVFSALYPVVIFLLNILRLRDDEDGLALVIAGFAVWTGALIIGTGLFNIPAGFKKVRGFLHVETELIGPGGKVYKNDGQST